ncbi:MAG: hypothetical protein R3321_13670, partial [Nitrososphaeraceae archaeon]|nr:hypothetical protein [Nitrososphaeraceae archaeon]
MSELKKLEYILFNIVPKAKRKKIFKILESKRIFAKDKFLWSIPSSRFQDQNYEVSYYFAKNCFVCNCDGYMYSIAKIRNSDLDQEEKQKLSNNFKCIHIFALLSYLLQKNEKVI